MTCPICGRAMLTEQPHTHYLIDPPRRFQQPDPDPLDVTPPEFGLQYVERSAGHPRLVRFREQRRRSRWGCSVALVAIVAALAVFWCTVLFVAVNVFAAPRGESAEVRWSEGRALPDGGPVPALLGAPRRGVGQLRRQAVIPRGAPRPAAASQPAGTLPVSVPAKTSGVASWYEARGYQGAVPWWRPGQDPVWAAVSRFADGRTYAVTVLVTGFCQCLVGQPGERAIDLSLPAFRELADPSVGLIRVTIEVPVQGPKLPATDQEEP